MFIMLSKKNALKPAPMAYFNERIEVGMLIP